MFGQYQPNESQAMYVGMTDQNVNGFDALNAHSRM
jgi:hypothetical protein